MTRPNVLTIDGPNGAGKTQLIKRIKAELEIRNVKILAVSTGDLYRVLGLLAYRSVGESLEAVAALPPERYVELAKQHQVMLIDGVVHVNGVPVPREEFRAEHIGHIASAHAAPHAHVREHLNQVVRQQAYAFSGLVVIDGRDTGTAVIPNAPLKIYLEVHDEVSAKRQGVSVEAVRQRNHQDKTREVSPLAVPEDAVVIDTSYITEEEVARQVLELLEEKFSHLLQSGDIEKR